MLNVSPKFVKSRVKSGKSGWCVDTRYVLANGTRKFFPTKEEAFVHIRKLSGEVTTEAKTTDSWKWTFEELAGHYRAELMSQLKFREIRNGDYTIKMRHLRMFLDLNVDGQQVRFMNVTDLSKGMVADQIINQLKIGRAKKTVANHMTSLSQLMEYSITKGCRETNPTRNVERKGTVQSKAGRPALRINKDIMDSIIDQMSPWWQLATRFACKTGLRQGEQRALNWGQLDLEKSKVRVTQAIKHKEKLPGAPKTKQAIRTVPLTRDIVQALKEEYIRQGRPNSNALVFPSNVGTIKMADKFLTNIKAACRRAGVPEMTWHELRHYYASVLLNVYSNDLNRVKNYMGHERIAITEMTYGHWLEDDEEDTEAVDNLTAAF